MATEYKLTDKNLNNITVRRKQLISRFSASSLKYVRILKQDIVHKFRSYNKILNFKVRDLDFLKKPLRIRYHPEIRKRPLWFQFRLVRRPNFFENNFVYSIYKTTRKTRHSASTMLDKSFNVIPFLTLCKLNKKSNKHFLLGQSTDYMYSSRIHNYQDKQWKIFSLVQSLNIISGFSADYRRRDLESFTRLPIYNRLGWFKWYFITSAESNTYINQRFLSSLSNSSLYRLSINKVSRGLFLMQRVIVFERRIESRILDVIDNLFEVQISISRTYFKILNLFKKTKKKKRKKLRYRVRFILYFLHHSKGFISHLNDLQCTIMRLNKIKQIFSSSFLNFSFKLFFRFLKYHALYNRVLFFNALTPLHLKRLHSLMKLESMIFSIPETTSEFLRFRKMVHEKILCRQIQKLRNEIESKMCWKKGYNRYIQVPTSTPKNNPW